MSHARVHPSPESLIEPKLGSDTPKKKSKWRSFFSCCSQEEPANPIPQFTKLSHLTDENGVDQAAYIVAKPIKSWTNNYSVKICFVSQPAKERFGLEALVGLDVADTIPDKKFRKTHSKMVGNFFKTLHETGKNPSSFIGKNAVRHFGIALPNGKTVNTNFTLNYTPGRDNKGKPVFFMVAQFGHAEPGANSNQFVNDAALDKQEEKYNM
ncbi:MAG: hypothetical protein P4M14_01980 [Gammaproteobacteria bacterium]|nr:hypothetical protein [Gammaproteobacteria bacterium]